MLRIANEERPWMEMLPTQGATIGELTLSMQQYPVQQGTLFTIHYHNELGRVWIAEQCWQRWCEGLIGTANRSVIDPELLYGIAEWGLAPLLQASDATLCQNEPPTSCSNLPHQLALHIKWTVEEHEFHSIIFTWPTGFLRNIVGELSAGASTDLSCPSCGSPCIFRLVPAYIN
ncbi:type III secretion system protein SsaQ [Salmonella enterica subsp. enterica]|uniref:Type III secretion system protein SsaQ n=1 Tax=Salmonella enterica I TaxID=59201 RepID=A0A379VT95_SALET|nr:type III secretion system protein SsaQ [Salmonella enterica subsp. enterica]